MQWFQNALGRKACDPRFRQRLAGFSLVELLVVIAVIGILSSLLLPALTKGKSAAQRIQCISSLHQLGIAAQLYWDDHEGLSFRYREGATNNGDTYWFGWISRGAEGARNFDLTQSAFYPYLAGRGVELCPQLRTYRSEFKFKASGLTYGYGYNLELSPTPAVPTISIRNIKQPAQTVLLADAAQINNFQPPASPDHPMLEEFYYVSPKEPTVHFRHRGRANTVLLDGHTETLPPLENSIDGRMPAENVGRLPAQLLEIH